MIVLDTLALQVGAVCTVILVGCIVYYLTGGSQDEVHRG